MSITLHGTWRVGEVLTDVTSMKLSDPTATYGVKRDDTQAVVVADDTAMAKTSTGIYAYTFDEPAAGLTYTYWLEIVYDGETHRFQKTHTALIDSPITVDEAKTHLRVDTADDDTYIETLLIAATNFCQNFQSRKYIEASLIDYWDRFPKEIRPPWSPLISVTTLQYVDTDGVTQTLDAANYDVFVGSEPGRIKPAYSLTWPSVRDIAEAVILTYKAGYGSASDVPDNIKHAIKLLVGHLYENRESTTASKLREIPQGVRSLLMQNRVFN